MTRLRHGGRPETDDLRSRVHFSAGTGHIWLHEHRMLLVHAAAQASLRKEIIDTLGLERARGLLTRMGYASGVRDADIALGQAGHASDADAFMTGPHLHTLEGIVLVTPLALEVDRANGRFYGEFRWEHSWEGEWHRKCFGIHTEPVCWTQIGYACGYTSAFVGRPILYREVECCGAGDPHCRIVGKPVDEWDDAEALLRYFNPESIAEQILDLQTQVAALRSSMDEREVHARELVGESPRFKAALELLQKASHNRITVLLLGETGAGKELFARSLHQMGPRAQAPFVALNCAAIPHELMESELFGVEKGAYTGAQACRAGRFERAHCGTLFLDEIGELSASGQAKLLRVLEEGEVERLGDSRPRKVDVRVVAASNVDLERAVAEGRFRSDLYYRLNAFPVSIPPLRERREDIPLLANRFLEQHAVLQNKKLRGYSDKARRALLAHPWPGNIRELRNVVERGVILAPNGGSVEIEHLFAAYAPRDEGEVGLDARGDLDLGDGASRTDLCRAVLDGAMTLDQVEATLLEAAVDKAHGRLTTAARLLGLSRAQLAYRLKRLQAAPAAGRDAPESG